MARAGLAPSFMGQKVEKENEQPRELFPCLPRTLATKLKLGSRQLAAGVQAWVSVTWSREDFEARHQSRLEPLRIG